MSAGLPAVLALMAGVAVLSSAVAADALPIGSVIVSTLVLVVLLVSIVVARVSTVVERSRDTS